MWEFCGVLDVGLALIRAHTHRLVCHYFSHSSVEDDWFEPTRIYVFIIDHLQLRARCDPFIVCTLITQHFFLNNNTTYLTGTTYTTAQSSSRFLQVGLQGYGQSICRETSLSKYQSPTALPICCRKRNTSRFNSEQQNRFQLFFFSDFWTSRRLLEIWRTR